MAEGSDNAGYSQMRGGSGLEVLAWKCAHHSVYSAVHSAEPEVPQSSIDQAKDDLLAYYQTSATCGCTPVVSPP